MDKAKRYQNAAQLAADLQALLRPTGERVDEDACPYRGLSSFGEDDTSTSSAAPARSGPRSPARELAAARGDRSVGRRQVLVRHAA